ncbi:hypothetical protein [Paenibacillus pabuli]
MGIVTFREQKAGCILKMHTSGLISNYARPQLLLIMNTLTTGAVHYLAN